MVVATSRVDMSTGEQPVQVRVDQVMPHELRLKNNPNPLQPDAILKQGLAQGLKSLDQEGMPEQDHNSPRSPRPPHARY